MASTSETGHAINLTNFKIIIERCGEFSTNYNPSNPDIVLANMTTTWTTADGLHSTYLSALEDTKLPINDREVLFAELRKRVVRAYNIYLATKATIQSKRDAKGLINKITGRNVKIRRLEDGTPDPNYVSNSQQSYVQKVDHFEKLVKLLGADANYAPNENELKITTLATLLADLKSANDKVYDVVAHAINTRTKRDHGIYDIGSGLIDIALSCKKYVRGLYGPKSPEATSVDVIKFRRFMKLNHV